MSSTKVSIVMAYFNRKEQLIQTINSINKSLHKNIELVIVDDASESDQDVNLFINNYIRNDIQVNIIVIKKEDKTWVNPCIPYNMGFKHATGDIIMIQNPEVMHVGDCITDCVNNLEKGDWMTFNCWGSPSFSVNKSLENKTNEAIIKFLKAITTTIGGNSVRRDNIGGWLNHYKNHFVAYHYLGAIYKEDLLTKMEGGFSEDFKNSVGADDDEFVKRLLFNKFNFKIREFANDSPVCIHLFHEKPKQLHVFDWRVNKHIFDKRCIDMGFKPINDIELAPNNEIPMSRQLIYGRVFDNKISVVVISTNIKRRLVTLINTINSIMKFYKCNFDELILSVDCLSDKYGEVLTDVEMFQLLSKECDVQNINIYFKNGEGMISNQCHGVSKTVGDIIIYCEDDILIESFPSKKNIIELTSTGVIMYNSALCYVDRSNEYLSSNFIVNKGEHFYKKIKSKYSVNLSDYSQGDNLSVTFPCAIMKKNIFSEVYNVISKIGYPFHIEAAFSHVINSRDYDTYIYCKDTNIPLNVPWKYRDNSTDIAVAGETIDRSLSRLSLLKEHNIIEYNKNIKNIEQDLIITTKIPSFIPYNKLNQIVIKLMNSNEPVWISRIGGSDTYEFNLVKQINQLSQRGLDNVRKANGYFDFSENKVSCFITSINTYIKSLKNSDLTLICSLPYEDYITENHKLYNCFKNLYNLQDNTIAISSYSFLFEEISNFFYTFKYWGENKKILVISPFSDSIKYQTQKERINNITKYKFPNCKILTYQTPVTYNTDNYSSTYFAEKTKDYRNWIELCDKMCEDISKIDYDVAFLACGIYSMRIGNFIKMNCNKKAVYVGGMLNVMFNIYGSRYDTEYNNQFINKEYQIDCIDNWGDLTDNNLLYVKNEILGAYIRSK